METYYCKRYRRARPGALNGVITDTVAFSAETAVQAEEIARRGFASGVAPMDWDKYFATLENAAGATIEVWDSAP